MSEISKYDQDPSVVFATARHSKKGKGSEEYPGLTSEGVDLVREKTRQNVLDLIEGSEAGSVIIFGGATDLARTKSSTRVSVDEIKTVLADRQHEYLIMDEKAINALVLGEDKKEKSTIHELSSVVGENKDKKVIVSYPLAISELSLLKKEKGRLAGQTEWKIGENETPTPFLVELLRRNDKDENRSAIDWVRSGGKIITPSGDELEGPNPLEVAKGYVRSLKRLEAVAKKLFPGRPLVIEVTAHSWEIDVMIDYLVHQGTVSVEGYEDVAKGNTNENPTIISEFEFPVIKVKDGRGELAYRGKTYEFDTNLLKVD